MSAKNSDVGCTAILAAFCVVFVISVLFSAVTRNRRDVCELRLAAATTQADSAAIYDERWPRYTPIAWRKCPEDAQ